MKFDTITAIHYIRKDWFYDIHVPGFENYLANGIWSHNCGLGKSLIELVWSENVVRQTKGNVLLLTPLAVVPQMIDEGKKFGIKSRRTKTGEVHKGINVTNYHRLSYYNPKDFAGVVCDECFPPDTLVDVVTLDNSLEQRYIKDVVVGDKILNASGVDYVQACRKRQVFGAVRFSAGGSEITCSENHPIFTLHGWRCAKDIRPGDYLLETETAVCLVRGDIPPKTLSEQDGSILRNILLSEMENEPSRTQSQSAYARNTCKDREESISLASQWQRRSKETNREGSESESNVRSAIHPKDERYQREEWDIALAAPYPWGQWNGADQTRGDADKCIRDRLVSCECSIGKEDSGLSHTLQAGCSQQETKDRNRSRRIYSHRKEEIDGCQEGQKAGFVRVDSVEILKQDDPRLDKYRDADGSLYFYDLEATRHPSFSVEGLLVHNSSILKNFDGKTRKAITEFMHHIPYRLLATATPAPNDYMELGTSSEALGVMSRNSMLGMFFTNDGDTTQQWRLKGHAIKRFWQWMASWARAVRKPSDLGFDDSKFILPKLNVKIHTVKSKAYDGFFAKLANTLKEQRIEKKLSLRLRCEKAASVLPTNRPVIAWTHLNPEADLLEELIPDAVQVSGSDPDEKKEEYLTAFGRGQIRALVTKPSIASFGLNYQHCADVSYFPSHSHEQYYQAIRRCWRFGQINQVNCHLVTSEAEANVISNMLNKERKSDDMYRGIVRWMNEAEKKLAESNGHVEMELPGWM